MSRNLIIASKIANASAIDGELISSLTQYLYSKYAIEIAYRSFADRVRGPWRDALVEHWQEHAKDERDHSYAIAMKIVALGGDPLINAIQLPVTGNNVMSLYKSLISMELKAIKMGMDIIDMTGNDTALRVMIEEFIVKDSHHKDDLIRMFGKLNVQDF